MYQGLPGSGKSTLAREAQANDPTIVIVEKDQIRAELAKNGWTWSREAEAKDVLPERDRQIGAALEAGLTVISSDTNFGRKHKGRLMDLARRHEAAFKVVQVDVPLQTCLERNAARTTGRVSNQVILEMYHKYVVNDPVRWPTSAPSVVDPEPAPTVGPNGETLMPAIICDLDGTLAINNGHRSFYDASTADQDQLARHVWRLICLYAQQDYQILYCSGREEKDREPTQRFLDQHGCPDGPLLMRATGDHRKDALVKRELFDARIRGKYRVEFVLDDRDQVVAMWRALGLACFQVAPGGF